MRRSPARPVPLWFLTLFSVLLASLPRVLEALGVAGVREALDGPSALAFGWGWLLKVALWVWEGIQAAGEITLRLLAWNVRRLWEFATLIADGAGELAGFAFQGLKKTWELFRLTYREILEPAWRKFWLFVDRARTWLERIFAPVFEFLRRVRDEFLNFYTHWIRPVLDTIGAARRILRILGQLGLDWAKALDRKLAEIADMIDRPFRLVLAKINEVINVVNRIVTADGLFQRLALIRSLERDARYAWRVWVNWKVAPPDAADVTTAKTRMSARTLAQVQADAEAALAHRAGPYEAWATELA